MWILWQKYLWHFGIVPMEFSMIPKVCVGGPRRVKGWKELTDGWLDVWLWIEENRFLQSDLHIVTFQNNFDKVTFWFFLMKWYLTFITEIRIEMGIESLKTGKGLTSTSTLWWCVTRPSNFVADVCLLRKESERTEAKPKNVIFF